MRRLLAFFRADTVGARLLAAFVLMSVFPVAVAAVLIYPAGAETLRNQLWQIAVLVVILYLAAALMGVRLALGISRPIERLARAAAAIGDGDLDHRVEAGGPREVTALANALNGMANDLARSREELLAHSTALEATVADRLRNLTALLEVTQALGSTLDLTETLWCAARSLVRVLRADAGAAYVLESNGEVLRPVTGYRLPATLRARTGRVPLRVRDHRIVAEACEARQAVFAEDAHGDARLDDALHELWAFRSVLFVPMFSRGRLVGGLFAGWGAPRPPLTREELNLIDGIGRQAGIAVQNAALFAEVQARAAGMTRLGEFGRMISSSLDLGQVLDRVAGAARELLDADVARVWVADADAQVVRLAVSQDRSGADVPGAFTELPLGVGVIGYVMSERRRHYTADLTKRVFEQDEWLITAGYASRLAVPLIVNDRPVGVLTILSKTARAFSHEEEEIVDLFASEAASALENARLFANVEAQAAVLAKKNAELDAFTYSVSHDLKAPLVTIQAMCGMVLEDQGERLDDEGKRILKRIEANAMHMAQLIGDLLALSKIGREARTPEAVPVRDVIDTVLDQLDEQIRDRNVHVECTADVTIWAVRVHLEQVFANLIGNAVKYLGSTAEPRVEIRADETDDRFVEFSVRDNGIGIDPAYHTRVFELFQRLREVDADGTGVGLALVKKIVDTAGGRIWVESAPGAGATFRFTWPAGATVRTP